jgi:hypothetical protein
MNGYGAIWNRMHLRIINGQLVVITGLCLKRSDNESQPLR